MSASELRSRLKADIPAPAAVEPAAFLEDELLPRAFAPVEPMAFALACTRVLWGAYGPRN